MKSGIFNIAIPDLHDRIWHRVRMLLFFLMVPLAQGERDRPAGGTGGKSGAAEATARLSNPRPMYTPLPGQIAIGTGDVSAAAKLLTQIADSVSPDDRKRSALKFRKLQALKSGLSNVEASKLQSDLFAQIPTIAEFFEWEDTDVPEFVNATSNVLYVLSLTIISSTKQHIIENGAAGSAGNIANFIKIFSIDGFWSESNWENAPIPVDAAGIMILDAGGEVNTR